VTLVTLNAQAPRVYPSAADPFLRVRQDVPAEYGPIEVSEGTVILAFVTETPAQEVIRAILRNAIDPLLSAPQTQERILAGLWETGYHWAAVTEITARRPKP
jgi:hypothetical protein